MDSSTAHHLTRRHWRRTDRLRNAVLDDGGQLSIEYWWPATQQLAGIHSGNVRADDSGSSNLRRPRHDRAQQTARTVPSGLQRGSFFPCVDLQVLSVHSGEGSEIQFGRNGKIL